MKSSIAKPTVFVFIVVVFAIFCAGCTSDQFGTAAAGILSGIGTGLSGL